MALIKVDGQVINIDVREELEQYEWGRPKWSDSKLIATSPFRFDSNPSFFCDLESGGWSDSGAYDIEWERGNLPKLLAFLRNESYEETCEYLTETYGLRIDYVGRLSVPNISLIKKKPKISIKKDILVSYNEKSSDYLKQRGISESVCRFMRRGIFGEPKCGNIAVVSCRWDPRQHQVPENLRENVLVFFWRSTYSDTCVWN